VHQAIAALIRPHREVLVMRDLDGLTGEETCVAMGLTEGARSCGSRCDAWVR
jgi:RNA polymerase sigma-70 factor (ECF subfamily)